MTDLTTKEAEAREWRRSEGTSAPATDTDTDWVLFVGGKAYDGAWLPEGLEAAILATERKRAQNDIDHYRRWLGFASGWIKDDLTSDPARREWMVKELAKQGAM